MEHFYQNIHGWSNGIETLYPYIVSLAPINKPSYFVEVGSWRGRSSALMAVEIIRSKRPIWFDCVDTWKGSLDEDAHQLDPAVINDTLYNEFIENIKPVWNYCRPKRMTSVEAAGTYADKSLDFVFIDAGHDYDSVKADILAWQPKIRPGGILAGHDYYHDPNSGVCRAVNELLTNFLTPDSCWMKWL